MAHRISTSDLVAGTPIPCSGIPKLNIACGGCYLPTVDFFVTNNNGNYLIYLCRGCATKEKQYYYNKQKPAYKSESHRRRKYGVSQDDFDSMRAEQKDLCYLCGKPEVVKRKGNPVILSVDHNHKTGKVRKLLCARCNIDVGHYEKFVNNPQLAESIQKYLEEHL